MGVASAQILPPNPQRSMIILFPNFTTTYAVGFGEDAVIGKGVNIMAAGHPIKLTYDDLGERIHSSVHGISSGGAATAGWIETDGDCPCTDD